MRGHTTFSDFSPKCTEVWGVLVTACLVCSLACYGVLRGWVYHRPREEHEREHTEGRLDRVHLQRDPEGEYSGRHGCRGALLPFHGHLMFLDPNIALR